MQVRRWLPDQPTRIGRHDWPDEGDNGTHMRLRAGSIVVLDRQAWRILEINGYTGDRWPDSYEKAWRDHVELWWHANELRRANNQEVKPAPERAEFYKRPVILVLRNENLPRSTPKHWCAPASHDWQVLPEHYAVCRACGELPPCRHGEYRWEGGPRWPEQNGGIPLMVPEYCCMGCAEPIKPRMRTVRFPGPNLWYPDLGEDTAVFHARTACADQVDCYRVQWQTEYDPRSSAHSAAVEFPGFEQFVLPRTRNAPDIAPHGQPSGAVPVGPQAAAGTEPHQPVHQSAHQPAPGAPSAPAAPSAPGAPAAPATDPAAPSRPAAPGPAPAPEAPAPVVEGAGLALRAAEELGLSLTERPAFHNAEQAARVIEELTAAVRNIALCLNDPAARARS
ncbi:hypothetical protein LUX12_12510 [Streptomyces somaliensis]|uniref:hypothetical protein n=1 Tax=Streptomyces somaliensis TaxID=78355 RepID=UPI0020CC8DAC|nr:hypothetical protein [Streptomyces somaliensis]MCP9945428.1 hypothetical protein [Streptomyces somaliensis]MCP9961374.1 hypothetical protein [Streptomyces somaliensis]MCP9974181.1 hypothetical protein [Streptomyces somaliensis]